jgi:hypothetical protein
LLNGRLAVSTTLRVLLSSSDAMIVEIPDEIRLRPEAWRRITIDTLADSANKIAASCSAHMLAFTI